MHPRGLRQCLVPGRRDRAGCLAHAAGRRRGLALRPPRPAVQGADQVPRAGGAARGPRHRGPGGRIAAGRPSALSAAAMARRRAPPSPRARPSAPGGAPVMLDDPRPAAYCVAGRPAAIVVTSGALAVLDPPQLRAVLAHESAHLAHGHHALATVTRGLAAAFPGVPLFTRGAAEVAQARRDVRRRHRRAHQRPAGPGRRPDRDRHRRGRLKHCRLEHGHPGAAVPAGAMAAAARAVPDRVERLLRPSSPARSAAFTAAADRWP